MASEREGAKKKVLLYSTHTGLTIMGANTSVTKWVITIGNIQNKSEWRSE